MKVSQLKPMPGYVLVEPAKSEKKTASGIYLPGKDDEKPQHGKVLACGEEAKKDCCEDGDCCEGMAKCPVKVGDNVIYKKWGGNDVTIDDVEYQFLKFEDVLAVVKKGN